MRYRYGVLIFHLSERCDRNAFNRTTNSNKPTNHPARRAKRWPSQVHDGWREGEGKMIKPNHNKKAT